MKTTNRILSAILMIGLAVFASCSTSDDNNPEQIEKQADVYVAGWEYDGTQDVAKVWENGTELYNLTDGTQNAIARSLFVSGNDVYVAGEEFNGTKDVAKVWKNGKKLHELSDGTQNAFVYSVSVSGSDVYVAGEESNGTKRIAKVWKNGVATPLTDGVNNARAFTVFVSGSDVYVGGGEQIDGVNRGKIWKNGNLYFTFPKNTIDYVNAIYVQGTDVYAAGDNQYWINPAAKTPTIIKIPDSYNINSLFVSGNDVYAAGWEYDGTQDVAKVWKNSIGTKLSNEDSEANSVFVWNNKVFIAGNEGSPAVIWEDGKPTKLAIEGSAYSVFVVERK